MAKLNDLNHYTESTIADHLSKGSTLEDITLYFNLMNSKADTLLLEIARAKQIEYLKQTELLLEHTIGVVSDAINFILLHSPNLMEDVRLINSSGVHEVTSQIHLNLILTTIMSRADELYNGLNIRTWIVAMFRKEGYYTTIYNQSIDKTLSINQVEL